MGLGTSPGAEKLAFFYIYLMLFVSRIPDSVMHVAVGLREVPDNPVFARRRLTALYGGPQPNQLTDFEFVHSDPPVIRLVMHLLLRLPAKPSQDAPR